MSSLHNPENRNNSHAALPSLGKRTREQTPYSDREVIETTLDALAMNGASLTKTIKACNGMTRGAYRVTIKVEADYNEVQVRLWENTHSRAIATAFIDRGHTADDKAMAAEELRSTIRVYLCR